MLMPLPLCLAALGLGLILLWFTQRQKTGKIIVSIGTLMLGVLSYGFVANSLLSPLEYKYPVLLLDDKRHGMIWDWVEPKWIVVLGGGVNSDPRLPLTSQLRGSVVRLAEGVRIHKALPRTKLLFAGGPVFGSLADSEAMAELALVLGINKQDILLISDANDTETQARRVKSVIGADSHILVTSASHMPRSVSLFRELGMNPIPAPTDHSVRRGNKIRPGTFFPGVSALYKTHNAIHEYLGSIWAKLRNRL